MAITVQDVEARVETDLDNATLGRILSGNIRAVERAAGKVDADTSHFRASGLPAFSLANRQTAIVEVRERRRLSSDQVTLDATDYRSSGSYLLIRLAGGVNSFTTWGEEVEVDYTPEVDVALRDRVIIDLCQMDIEFRALDSEKVGDYSQSQKDYKSRRRALISQVREGRSPVL